MKILLTYLILFSLVISYAQNNRIKGYGTYQKQDKSFISSNLRGKHSVSVGFYTSINTPFNEYTEQLVGGHLGYNYLILTKKDKVKEKRSGKTKKISKNIIQDYLGVHLDFSSDGEYFANVKYYHPLIAMRGRTLSWLLFNEIGLGIHHQPYYLQDSIPNPLKKNLSLEILRIKFFTAPLFFTATTNYDLSNNFTVPEPKNIEFMFGLKYYIYKNKVN